MRIFYALAILLQPLSILWSFAYSFAHIYRGANNSDYICIYYVCDVVSVFNGLSGVMLVTVFDLLLTMVTSVIQGCFEESWIMLHTDSNWAASISCCLNRTIQESHLLALG